MGDYETRLEMMVDIETLGLKAGSVVASIGAIVFDHEGFHADRFFARLDLSAQLDSGLTVDGSTIKWWMSQTNEAKVNTFVGDTDHPVDALIRLADFIRYNRPVAIWAKGPQFDITQLECLYDALGFSAAPWSYRAIRDLRTMLATADVSLDGSVPAEAGAAKHSALTDCAYQIRELIQARSIIDGKL